MPVPVDYISPLPPVRSGIADYSTDLLPHLAERLDVRVLRLPDQPVAPEVEARWRPVAAERAGEGGRLPLYQMGNNPFHEAVAELAWERPGVLTLHDLVLHHLLHKMTLGRRDFEGYRSRLAADHGWVGEAASHPRHWGIEDEASVFALPAHRSLLRRQRGVLVHSQWAADRIAEDDSEIQVRAVPMGIPLPPKADRRAGLDFRERLGISAKSPLLGSFGFQTPIKRTATAVRALADARLANAHLLVAGEASPALDLESLAGEAGVLERVHLVGYLPFDDLTAAIAASDLCLNLRYPTAGETSASLLRVLAVGKPCLVSDFAQFAELPDKIVVKVPLVPDDIDGSREAAGLAEQVHRLLAEPGRLQQMATAAREHVRRHHDPPLAAAAVAHACEEWRESEPLDTRDAPLTERQVPAPTSLAWPWLPARIRVEGHRSPWPEGRRRRLEVELENTGEARWLAAHRGPGGMALSVVLLGSDADEREERPWIPLQRDIDPGGVARFSLDLRRPSGSWRLRIEPRVLEAPEAECPYWEEPV